MSCTCKEAGAARDECNVHAGAKHREHLLFKVAMHHWQHPLLVDLRLSAHKTLLAALMPSRWNEHIGTCRYVGASQTICRAIDMHEICTRSIGAVPEHCEV